jgi:hypothetical protein
MQTANVVALQDLVALDPPSAGTASPDNPLAKADLIVARFSDGSTDCIVYGKDRLKQIVENDIPARLSKIVVLVKDRELEILCAMVKALRGHCDVASVTEH